MPTQESNYPKDQYFGNLKPNDLIRACLERVVNFDNHIRGSGRLSLWQNSYANYNLGIYKDGRLLRVGDQGEFTEMYANDFRNLLLHILNMTTEQKPSFDARSTNTDFKSQSQAIVGNSVLEHYNSYGGLGDCGKAAVEDVLQFADSYIYQGWDFSLGDPYMADPMRPGRMKKQGDVLHKNFMPIDVIFDFMAGMMDAENQWYILRDYQNKWDLIEKFPELRDKILAFAQTTEKNRYSRLSVGFHEDTDNIPVFIFIHGRTDAVPNGRFFTFIGEDTYMIDSQLPKFYKRIPVYRLCASRQRGSGFGYSVAYDLLPLQEALNGLISVIITNQSTFGVQNITMPDGSNISLTELTDGLNLLTYDSKLGKPEALNLLNTPKEIFDFVQMIRDMMQTISGINSVARGNPEASLKSGSALALVQSMAIQFNSGLQRSYARLLEDLGTGLINILKEVATTPRMIEIVGKNNKRYLDEFSKADLSNIDRVTVDLGNPVARTTAGRVNIADQLLQQGLIKDPQQYIQVMSTGKLEPLIEGQQAELMLIRSENESLSEGKQVPALITDDHSLHVLEHKAVLGSPEARANPDIANLAMDHIQEHINLWMECPPQLSLMLKQEGPPPMAPPQEPAAQPGQDGKPPSAAKTMVAAPPAMAKAATVQLPRMPKPAQVPTGG